MKVKDTTISWERIRMIYQKCRDEGIEGLFATDKICEYYAGISFKAGIKEVVDILSPIPVNPTTSMGRKLIQIIDELDKLSRGILGDS